MTAAASRLDLPPAAEWTPEQRAAAERIAAGPRGALLGPFVPLLHAPELMTRLQLVGEHLRFATVLDADVFELAVLTVARYWDQPFEWGFHQPLAVRAGVPESVVEEIGTGTRPSAGRPLLAQVWDAVVALLRTGHLAADAVHELEPAQLVELLVTVGYYTTLALTMNVAGTPAPDGAPRLPALADAIPTGDGP